MKTFKIGMACVVLTGVLLADRVSALGFGDLEVLSYLNQPLRARLMLIAEEDEFEPPKLLLAAEEDYQELGLILQPVLEDLGVLTPIRNERGWILELSTREPVNELVLDLVLVIGEGNSQQLKHYPILMDLLPAPDLPERQRQPVATAPVQPVEQIQQNVSPNLPPVQSGEGYGPVRVGDSLFTIAKSLNPNASDSDIDQLMDSIFALNPQAFIRGDRNQLRAGAQLRLPEIDQAVADAPPPEVTRDAPPTRADETPRLKIRPIPSRTELLESLTNWLDVSDREISDNQADIQQDLAFAATEIETFRGENANLRERITNLEDRVQNLRRLMALRVREEQQALTSLQEGQNQSDSPAGLIDAGEVAVSLTTDLQAQQDAPPESVAEPEQTDTQPASAASTVTGEDLQSPEEPVENPFLVMSDAERTLWGSVLILMLLLFLFVRWWVRRSERPTALELARRMETAPKLYLPEDLDLDLEDEPAPDIYAQSEEQEIQEEFEEPEQFDELESESEPAYDDDHGIDDGDDEFFDMTLDDEDLEQRRD